jgi:hypothetical protein
MFAHKPAKPSPERQAGDPVSGMTPPVVPNWKACVSRSKSRQVQPALPLVPLVLFSL